MQLTPTTIFTDLRTCIPLLRAICKGQYKMPWKTCFWTVLCLVYFLSPIDVLPDIVPILGFADDGAFILFVLLLIHQELQTFRTSQTANGPIIEAKIIKEEKHD